ncbi:MAG: PEP-CTERM sorting domain-containing protein [Bythopirellula sp.]
MVATIEYLDDQGQQHRTEGQFREANRVIDTFLSYDFFAPNDTQLLIVGITLSDRIVTASSTSHTIHSFQISIVPEPSTFQCALVGVGILGWIRRGSPWQFSPSSRALTDGNEHSGF